MNRPSRQRIVQFLAMVALCLGVHTAAARFWVGNIVPLIVVAVVIAFTGSLIGLLLSYYVNLPAGPAIVLTLGGLYVLSMAIAPLGPLVSHLRPRWHFER